jgi:hypothetical protein
MVKRRPMGSALSLNSETLAFIHGGPTGAKREAELVKPLTVGHSPDRSEGSMLDSISARPVIRRRGRRPKASAAGPLVAPETASPSYPGDFPPLLVSLTTRLSPGTAEALRRAALEQKLRRRRPQTQQEIVEAAVRGWLTANGFLRIA